MAAQREKGEIRMNGACTDRTRPPRCLDVRCLTALCAIGGTVCATLTWAPEAFADNAASVAISLNRPTDDRDPELGFGGVDVTVGPRMNLLLIDLSTEVSAGIHGFHGVMDASAYRLMAGGRLGIGAIIRPSIFAHVGVGHLRYLDATVDASRTNLAGDLGVALEFTALPVLDFGIHGSYNGIAAGSDEEPFRWFQAGVMSTLTF